MELVPICHFTLEDQKFLTLM